MNDRRKFDRLARNSGAKERDKLIDGIRSQCSDVCQKRKRRTLTGGRLTVLLSSCAVAVCAAIILPCVLLLGGNGGNGGNGDNGGGTDNRYCSAADVETQPSQYTIKQYGEQFNESILYLDWYDVPNVCTTNIITLKETDEQIGIDETIINISTLESVRIQLIKWNFYIDTLDEIAKMCDSNKILDGVKIEWIQAGGDFSAVFVNDSYRYYVTYSGSDDEARFFEIIAEMLEAK